MLASRHSMFGASDPFAMMNHMMSSMMSGHAGDAFAGLGGIGGPGGMSCSESYSYSSTMGRDGRPVVQERRHSAIRDAEGHFQERYDVNDEAEQVHESGVARGIGDRSIAYRRVRRGEEEEEFRDVNGMEEEDVAAFNDEWKTKVAPTATFRNHDHQTPLQIASKPQASPAQPRLLTSSQKPASQPQRSAQTRQEQARPQSQFRETPGGPTRRSSHPNAMDCCPWEHRETGTDIYGQPLYPQGSHPFHNDFGPVDVRRQRQ